MSFMFSFHPITEAFANVSYFFVMYKLHVNTVVTVVTHSTLCSHKLTHYCHIVNTVTK